MLTRAGKRMHWIVKPEGDATWNQMDWGTAATLEARWAQMGICEEERRQLIPCAVWKAKFPGLTYTPAIESKLQALLP
jgi:hypothetical protein